MLTCEVNRIRGISLCVTILNCVNDCQLCHTNFPHLPCVLSEILIHSTMCVTHARMFSQISCLVGRINYIPGIHPSNGQEAISQGSASDSHASRMLPPPGDVGIVHLVYRTSEQFLEAPSAQHGAYLISKDCPPQDSLNNYPLISSVSFVTWNVRSLFKIISPSICSKFDMFTSLVSSHDIIGLTETHSTIERICMLQRPLPQSHIHYCSHYSVDTGGLILSVSKKFSGSSQHRV